MSRISPLDTFNIARAVVLIISVLVAVPFHGTALASSTLDPLPRNEFTDCKIEQFNNNAEVKQSGRDLTNEEMRSHLDNLANELLTPYRYICKNSLSRFDVKRMSSFLKTPERTLFIESNDHIISGCSDFGCFSGAVLAGSRQRDFAYLFVCPNKKGFSVVSAGSYRSRPESRVLTANCHRQNIVSIELDVIPNAFGSWTCVLTVHEQHQSVAFFGGSLRDVICSPGDAPAFLESILEVALLFGLESIGEYAPTK